MTGFAGARPPTPRSGRALRGYAAGLGVVFITVSVIAGIRSGTAVWVYNVASVANLVLGLLIWSRRPENRLGPLLTLIGLLGPVSGLATIGGFGTIESNIPAHGWRSTVGALVGGILTGLIVFSLIWFPNGKLPSSRWRWLQWLAGIWATIWAVSGFLGEPVDGSEHPFLPEVAATGFGRVYEVGLSFFGVLLLLAAVSLGSRYRRADLIGRLQLRWLFFVVAVYVVFWAVLSSSAPMEDWDQSGLVLDALFLASLPIAMGIAVLRYRLYDIDRIISRTVTYALVAIVVGAIYAAPVVLLSSTIGAGNDLVVAGATLAAAAAFNPVRRRIQAIVDRRFNRARFDGEVVLAQLSALMSHQTGIKDLDADLRVALGRTLSPQAASLWIREPT